MNVQIISIKPLSGGGFKVEYTVNGGKTQEIEFPAGTNAADSDLHAAVWNAIKKLLGI
jgi:hypothetical protein